MTTKAPTTALVSGVGAITALGATARATWTRVLAGERGFGEIDLVEPRFVEGVRGRVVAQVSGVTPSGKGRTTDLALAAAREALADAGVDPRTQRVGLVVGGSTANLLDTELQLGRPSAALARHPLTAPTDALAEALGPFVRVRTLSSACSSGANAIALGGVWLELGLVDAVLCGGADALCRVTFAGFNALGAVDPEGARPFDVARRGLTLGEGAGFLVLTREATRAYCTLLGWAARSEAHHITNPEASGEAPYQAMRAALARAGLAADDVDYVNAHGTGTPLNDPMETRALRRLFGARRVPVSSQKGMIGHTLAAAGGIEAVLTALAIHEGVLPPTGGLRTVDPACDLEHVREATKRPIDVAVSSSFAFGGMDAALVFGRRDRRAPARATRRVFLSAGAAPRPLDEDRARRLDPTSRMAAALGAAHEAPAADGLVLGNAFGAIDRTAALVARIDAKGPRFLPPADFPGLVPSSPGGHASIYLGLTGPSVVVADAALTGECAIAHAFELVAAGDADGVVAGAVEEASPLVEAHLGSVFGEGRYADAARGEGGAMLRVAAEGPAALAHVIQWRGEMPELPAPGDLVVCAVSEPALDRTPWAHVPRLVLDVRHEAGGAIAFGVAAAKVSAREAARVLVFGTAGGRGYAGIVAA